MQHVIEMENIKRGGCANTIRGRLGALESIRDVEIDVECGRIILEGPEDSRAPLVETLLAAGYPEKGSVEGIRAAKVRARSFVSCAIGKLGS